MAIVKPFKGVRPPKELVEQVESRPYDVLDSEEARAEAGDNQKALYHNIKPEINFEAGTSEYDPRVYEEAARQFAKFQQNGWLVQDEKEQYYIYAQTSCLPANGGKEKTQYGIVVGAYSGDYQTGVIKKHELTRADKEQDRINHVDYCDANTGPIFLTYRSREEVNQLIDAQMTAKPPVYDFISEDGIGHTVWVMDDPAVIEKICGIFQNVENLYIADGHHRCASAVRVGGMRRSEKPDYTGEEEFNYFLSVIFPDEQLYVMDYNRIVKDLNGNTPESFMEKVQEKFAVTPYGGNGALKPEKKHTFGMYLDGRWMLLEAKTGTYDPADPVGQLDVSTLQSNLLSPILGIGDPRTDKRIDFVGGIRGLDTLSAQVDEGSMAVAFSMYPTTMDDLMDIADADAIMPPNSTWFEPKLRSGLFVHKLSE